MASPEALDLEQLDIESSADAGCRCYLIHPITNIRTEGWLQLLGVDSNTYLAAQRKMQNRRLRRAAKKRRGEPLELTVEELEAEALDLLVIATIGCGGLAEGARPIEFSPEAMRALYQKRHWIRQQAEEFIGDRANFLPACATPS